MYVCMYVCMFDPGPSRVGDFRSGRNHSLAPEGESSGSGTKRHFIPAQVANLGGRMMYVCMYVCMYV